MLFYLLLRIQAESALHFLANMNKLPSHNECNSLDRSFIYASPRLWNQLPDSFYQPRQSCLNLPPHSLVEPSLSSSPLSAIHDSFTVGSKVTFSTNPSHLNRLLVTRGLDNAQWFILVRFLFKFSASFHVVD